VPPSLNFPQLDFVKPSSGFHPVTWERVIRDSLVVFCMELSNANEFRGGKMKEKENSHN
jgi:hypothetical protein